MRYFMRNSRAIKIACGIAVGATTIAWVYKDRPLYAAVPYTEVQQSSPFIVNNQFKPAIPWDSNWDFRDPDSLVRKSKRTTDEFANEEKDKEERDKVKSKAARHLIFIRHGQYNLDPKDDKDRILTKLGREQAKLTGERLKELDLPYTRLVKSTMTRARETASIIQNYLSPDITVEETDLLREGAPIPPEPPSRNWRPPVHKYFADHARIEAAFRKYIHRASPEQEETSYEVFVCHANVIRYFVCRALQIPPEAWLRISLKNGSITWITISPSGNVSLRTLGDAGFMSPDKTSRG